MTSIPPQVRAKYERRLKKLVEVLTRMRFSVQNARRDVLSLFATPTGARPAVATFENAEACSQYLINDHSIVTVPWDDAGSFLSSRLLMRLRMGKPKTR